MGSCNISGSYALFLLQQVITCPSVSRLSVGEMKFLLGVGRVTLHRRMETVSLLYHAGDLIPEKCIEFVRAINHSCMVSKLNV